VVDITACGVGLTTCNCIRGDLGDDPSLLPVVPGHELVGVVSSVGPDVVGTPSTVGWALDHLDSAGRLVVVTTFPGVSASVTPRQLTFGQLSVLGSRYASRSELFDAADMVADGRVRPVIGERSDLEGAPALLGHLGRNEVMGRGAVVVAAG